MKNNKKYWIFTFGFGQTLKKKSLANHYVKIWANNELEARKKMHDLYGAKWAFQYDSEDAAGVEEFNLKLLKEIKE